MPSDSSSNLQAPSLQLSYASARGDDVRVLALDGSVGGKRSFDGSVSDSFPTQGLTLSCWIKSNQDDPEAVLFSYDADTGNAHRLWITNPGNLVIHYGASKTDTTSLSWSDGHWHHLTVIVAPADRTHYQVQILKDGILLWQSQAGLSYTPSGGLQAAGEMVLGKGASGGSENGYVGELSEFQLWKGVRTSNQLATMLQRRANDTEEGLVLHWPLDTAPTGNTIPPKDFVSSTLYFREPDPANSDFVTAEWTSVAGGSSYDLQVVAEDGRWGFYFDDIAPSTGAAQRLAVPGVLLNRKYKARVRANDENGAGPWSATAEMVPIDLRPIEVSLAWPVGSDLNAQWLSVDQAQQYRLVFYQGTGPTPYYIEQQGTTYSLADKTEDPNAWRFVVRACSMGSFGPGNPTGSIEAPDLAFSYIDPTGNDNGTFEFDWTPPGIAPAFYLLELLRGTDTLVAQHMPGTTVPPVSRNAPDPVTAGQEYTGRLRAISLGAIGARGSKTITLVLLARPKLVYSAVEPPGAEALDLTWESVLSGATYDLNIFVNGGTSPDKRPNVVSPYGLTDLLSTDETSEKNQSYVFRLFAIHEGEIGPPNKVITPPLVEPTFSYVYPGGDDPGTMTVAWTPTVGEGLEVYLRVFRNNDQTPRWYGKFPITQGSRFVPPPDGGFVPDTKYRLHLRPLAEGTLAQAVFGTLTIHRLATPAVKMQQTVSGQLKIEAAWEAINSELTPQYEVEVDTTLGQTQTGRTYDLTKYLDAQNKVTVMVRGVADGSYGPWSIVGTPPDLAPNFKYVLDASNVGTLAIHWTSTSLVSLVYLTIASSASTTPAARELFTDEATASYTVAPPAGGFQEGVTYTSLIKSAVSGALSAPAPSVVVIHQLAQPVPFFPTTNSPTSVLLEWPDIRNSQQVTANVQVEYIISVNGTVKSHQNNRTYDLTSEISEAGSISVTVQGSAEGSYGIVSQPTVPQTPNITSISYDATPKQMTVDWEAAQGAQHYYLEVYDDSGGQKAYAQWLNASSRATSYTSTFSLNRLSLNHGYTARIRSLAGSALSTFGSKGMTVKELVGPSDLALQQRSFERKIIASWQFDTSGLSQVSYQAELLDSNGNVLQALSTTKKSVDLTYPNSVLKGTVLAVRVRAVAESNYGLWCEPKTIEIGSTLPVPIVNSAQPNSQSVITVTWSITTTPPNTPPPTELRYEVNLSGSGVNYTLPNVSNTIAYLQPADTHVQWNTDYNVKVRAVLDLENGEWSSEYPFHTALVPPDTAGSNSASVDDPIAVATGGYSYTHADIVVQGVVPLRFVAYYNTFTPLSSENLGLPQTPLGPRWNHAYNTRIVVAESATKVYVVWADGALSTYKVPPSITGPYTKQGIPNGDLLVREADLTYTLTRKDQTAYLFDTNGFLQRIITPQGNPVVLSYSQGLLQRVTDSGSKRYLQITYYGSGENEGRVSDVTDNAGRAISYTYTNGNLTTYVDVQDETREFTYHDKSLMWTATDQNKNTFITNTYDVNNRVISQKDARAVANKADYATTLAYEDVTQGGVELVRTTVTDRNGDVTVYLSNKINWTTISEVHVLAVGRVWRKLRTFDGMLNLLTETIFQGPPDAAATRGNTTRYSYDGAGNLLSVTDPLGNVRSFSYDERNNLTSSTDILGNATTLTYYPGTNLVHTITEPLGRKLAITYKAVGNGIKGLPETITDYPVGDWEGRVGNVTTFHYNTSGENTEIRSPLGIVTAYTYDEPSGWLQLVEIKDQQQEVIRQTVTEYWPETGLRKAERVQYSGQPEAEAYVTSYVYDFVGMLTSTTDPLGRETRYRYDPNSLLDRITYPTDGGQPDITEYSYDRDDRLVKTTYSAAAPRVVEQFAYDAMDRLTFYLDANVAVTSIRYRMPFYEEGVPMRFIEEIYYPPIPSNESGQQVKNYYARQFTYDAPGRLISNVMFNWTDTWKVYQDRRYYYNPQPNLGPSGSTNLAISIWTHLGKGLKGWNKSVANEDPLGHLASWIDERSNLWNVAYTAEVDASTHTTRRVRTSSDPLGNQTVEIFDADGRLVARRAGRGNEWRQTVITPDALGRPVRVDEPDPNDPSKTVSTTFSYRYDSPSKCLVLTLTPYNSPPSSYAYDGAGQWVKYTDPAGNAVQLTYTPRGQLHTYTNGREQTLTYGYDRAGRLVSTTLPDNLGVITHVLDGNGNRLQTKLGDTLLISRTFDALNRMTDRTNELRNETVSYTYTPLDLVSTLRYPGLTTPVTYAYDLDGRLLTVRDWQGRETQYSYYPTGQLETATLPGGVNIGYDCDEAGRNRGYSAMVGHDVVASASYTLNAFGEIIESREMLPLAPSWPKSNRQFTYTQADRLATVDGQQVSYDKDGNMTAIPGLRSPLTYDVFNQLGNIGTATAYKYDADGLRDALELGGIRRRFVHDVGHYQHPLIQQADPQRGVWAAAPQALRTGVISVLPSVDQPNLSEWPDDTLNAVLVAFIDDKLSARYVYGMGLLGREDADGTYHSYVFDGRGSTLAMVREDGVVTDRYAYSLYGQPAGRVGTTSNPFQLHGRYGVMTDPHGICFMRARYYVPSLMRFISKDILSGDPMQPQTLNRYAFVTGNPLRLIDPLGLSGREDDDDDDRRNLLRALLTLLFTLGLVGAAYALKPIPPPVIPRVPGGSGGQGIEMDDLTQPLIRRQPWVFVDT